MRPNSSKALALAALLLIIFIDSLSYFLIIPVFLRLLSSGLFSTDVSLALRNIAFGITLAFSPLAYFLAAPWMGRLSDQIGRKKVLGICLLIALVGFFVSRLSITLASFSILLLGRLLSGVATSSQPIAWAAITDISSTTKKAYYLSLAAIAMTVAMMVGPLLGAYLSDSQLIETFSNETPFTVAIILVVINLLLLIFSFKETYQGVTKEPAIKIRAWEVLHVMAGDRRIRGLLITLLVYEFAWSLYFQDISLYLLQAYHYTPEQTSHLLTWASIWMVLGLVVVYPFILRLIQLSTIVLASLIIFTITLLVCAIVRAPGMHWIATVPMAVVVGIVYPSLLAVTSDKVTMKDQGWVMGLAAAMLALAWMSSAFLMGWLTDISQILPLYVAAISGFISVLVFGNWYLKINNNSPLPQEDAE